MRRHGPALLAALATLAAGAPPASAAARYCQRVEAEGNVFPVHVDRGDVSCRTARRIVRVAIEDVRWPAGWRCQFGRSGDAFALQCTSGPRAKPRHLVRASKHL